MPHRPRTTDMAPRHGQPVHKSLWRGRVGAWCPSLGSAGFMGTPSNVLGVLRIPNNAGAGYVNDAVADVSGVPAPSYVYSGDGLALDNSVVNNVYSTGLQPKSGVFTFAAWVCSANVTGFYQNVMALPSNYMLFCLLGGTGSFWSTDGLNGASLGLSINLNEWTHLGFVREGNSITGGYKCYKNGVITGTANTGTFTPSSEICLASVSGSSQNFIGYADDFGAWDRALSAPEMAILATRRRVSYELEDSYSGVGLAGAGASTNTWWSTTTFLW